MLSSIGIQTFSCKQSLFQPKTSKIPKNPSIPSFSKKKKNLKPLAISASSSSPSVISNRNEEREKMKVVVKAIERPRLVLKFIWMEKNIGIAVDQLIPGGGGGTIPVSPYYFWPRRDAWEELKVMMETKPWISNTQKVFLLNQATDIINLWQATGHG